MQLNPSAPPIRASSDQKLFQCLSCFLQLLLQCPNYRLQLLLQRPVVPFNCASIALIWAIVVISLIHGVAKAGAILTAADSAVFACPWCWCCVDYQCRRILYAELKFKSVKDSERERDDTFILPKQPDLLLKFHERVLWNLLIGRGREDSGRRPCATNPNSMDISFGGHLSILYRFDRLFTPCDAWCT